jgi:hypothetical protein
VYIFDKLKICVSIICENSCHNYGETDPDFHAKPIKEYFYNDACRDIYEEKV